MSSSGTGSHETALILDCVRMHWDASSHESIHEILSERVNWAEVISVARSHEIVPLVRANLFQFCPTAVSSWVKAQLEDDFLRIAADNIQSARELIRIFESFQEPARPALAFKGPTLAVETYGKLSLRHCRDLDILVDRKRIPDALAVLKSLGYELALAYRVMNASKTFKTDKHIQLTNPFTNVHVELHWALTLPGFSFHAGFDDLWSRRQHIAILDKLIPCPSPEDLLAILCVHGASHYWTSLKWILDIAEFVRKHADLDWEQALARTEHWGCRRIFLIGLASARNVASIALPEAIERSLESENAAELVSKEWHSRLFLRRSISGEVEKTLLHIRSRERARDRLRLIVNLVGGKLRYWKTTVPSLLKGVAGIAPLQLIQ
jgi:hypothetical protein